MKDISILINTCKQQRSTGKTNEDIVAFLRDQGCSKVESITVLARAFDVELNDAKEIVHLSKAWSDVRERDDCFHQTLDQSGTQ